MRQLLAALACVVLACAVTTMATRAEETPQNSVGYATVAEAHDALRAKPAVTFAKNGDWTVATDTDGSMWSFTPANHPAHPSLGRRQLIRGQDGGFLVETRILCQAQKAACDNLRADYQLLDRRMTDAIRAKK